MSDGTVVHLRVNPETGELSSEIGGCADNSCHAINDLIARLSGGETVQREDKPWEQNVVVVNQVRQG